MKYTFSKPYEFEGEKFSEIEFDLESMTGEDISKAKRNFLADGRPALYMITADQDFAAHVVAIAMSKPIEFVRQMPAVDYCRLTTLVTAFLVS